MFIFIYNIILLFLCVSSSLGFIPDHSSSISVLWAPNTICFHVVPPSGRKAVTASQQLSEAG